MAKKKGRQAARRRHPDQRREKILKSGTIELPAGSIPSPSGGKSSAIDFTSALMQGHPAATKAVEDVLRDEASLADKFVSETYTLPKRLGLNGHLTKKVEPILASYRDDMRKAHRFVLDNEFVRYVTEVSSLTPPAKLLYRLQFATLPYDITWIEFDLKTKVHVMRAVHNMDDSKFDYDNVADRLGLIIRRLSDTEAIVEIVCETHGDYGLIGTTICYFFSVQEHEWSLADGGGFTGCRPLVFNKTGRSSIIDTVAFGEMKALLEDENLVQLGAASLWGYSASGKSTVIEKARQMQDLRLPDFLMRHGALGTGRMRTILETFIGHQTAEKVNQTIVSLLVNEAIEFTGMMRWIATVLACLNEVPVTTRLVQPTHTMRAGLTRRVPAFDYHRVTLRLPKTRPVPFIERHLSNIERHHKAHEVRSHWRTYLHERHCGTEDHQWEYDTDHGYRLCGKCMSFSRLIHEHVRGDPSLGWVRKDYVVKPTKQV